ncbi:hypothetical protein QBC39DRAFT_393079 [Podospora conica]|nr:hypothetical protein QBC39DRAFT_393079 [Schizothecium conicum]
MDYLVKIGWVFTTNNILNIERIGFRIARGKSRMIITATIVIPIPTKVLLNIDADEPRSVSGIVPNYRNDYGIASSRLFSIVGLDIESLGKYTGIKLEENRTLIVIKAKNSTRMCEIAYKILEELSPDIVNIYNSFGFDLKMIAVYSSLSPILTDTTERRRLGKSRSGVYWRLPNGTTIIDSMYDVDKYLRSKWVSISLANMAKTLRLPPKLDGVEIIVENNNDYDVSEILRYNMLTYERLFALVGTSRSTF